MYSSSFPLLSRTTALPSLPARAVRPHLWLNTLGSWGGSNCSTTSTSGRSSPRAATSVHSSTPGVDAGRFTNAWNVAARLVGDICPCSEWIENGSSWGRTDRILYR